MTPESINQRITDFRQRFGEAHLYFAYHTAFPLALTPDLAYRLWITGKTLGISDCLQVRHLAQSQHNL